MRATVWQTVTGTYGYDESILEVRRRRYRNDFYCLMYGESCIMQRMNGQSMQNERWKNKYGTGH